jgi:hypothetical protein
LREEYYRVKTAQTTIVAKSQNGRLHATMTISPWSLGSAPEQAAIKSKDIDGQLCVLALEGTANVGVGVRGDSIGLYHQLSIV